MFKTAKPFARHAVPLACSLGLITAMAVPSIALAAGKTGTTKVTVTASEANMDCKVPTVIPFSAGPDGVLTGPSPSGTTIENHSLFDIHVTNMSVEAQEPWQIVEDAESSDQENAIDFQVGPTADPKDAFDATQPGGIDLSSSAQWDLDYDGGAKDTLELESTGNISKTTQDLSGGGSHVATITWTLAAGQHAARS